MSVIRYAWHVPCQTCVLLKALSPSTVLFDVVKTHPLFPYTSPHPSPHSVSTSSPLSMEVTGFVESWWRRAYKSHSRVFLHQRHCKPCHFSFFFLSLFFFTVLKKGRRKKKRERKKRSNKQTENAEKHKHIKIYTYIYIYVYTCTYAEQRTHFSTRRKKKKRRKEVFCHLTVVQNEKKKKERTTTAKQRARDGRRGRLSAPFTRPASRPLSGTPFPAPSALARRLQWTRRAP